MRGCPVPQNQEFQTGMCWWVVLGMNERISMNKPGNNGIYVWGKQEEESGGMKIRLHKGKQQKGSFITGGVSKEPG